MDNQPIFQRKHYQQVIIERLANSPIVSILGARQTGKTTLATLIAEAIRREKNIHYFDLEDPQTFDRLSNPKATLESLKDLIIIDEIQRLPSLFTLLRVLADRKPLPARFLILGSASPELVKGVSESLAGRVAFVDLSGFDLRDIESDNFRTLWWRGGFPRSYLASSNSLSREWQENFIRSFLERDVPQLGINISSVTLRRFWSMVAHYHGQTWNAAEFARSLGTSETTARRYLDILTSTFMVRQLPPWFENVGKRQVKSPKVYVRDSGLLHTILLLPSIEALQGHPKLGSSWEGFVLEQVLTITGDRHAFFWATHTGAELDLMLTIKGKRYGFEFKYTDSPRPTKSMHIALQDLRLDRILVVYPGKESYALKDNVECVSILHLLNRIQQLQK